MATRVTQQVAEVLMKGDPEVRVTQQVAEALMKGDPDARVTQQAVEIAMTGIPDARVTQQAVEILYSPPVPGARLTQQVTEVLHTGDPDARLTQQATEVLHTGMPDARFTQQVIEVLHSDPAVMDLEPGTYTLTGSDADLYSGPETWLGSWAYRRKITIDNTNIDSDLSHFPVPVVLGTSIGQSSQDLSDVFDELASDANRFKIAITQSDGTTQIYGDIETWDDANEKAVIHVSSSALSISSSATTDLYIYYDSTEADNTTYISDSGDTAAQSVYDSNSELIAHMSQDPTTAFTGGTATADSEYGGSFLVANAFDGNLTTSRWSSTTSAMPHWLKYDFGSGNSKIIKLFSIWVFNDSSNRPKSFTFEGSNNDSDYDTLYTGQTADATGLQQFICTTADTAYRYFRWVWTDSWDASLTISIYNVYGSTTLGMVDSSGNENHGTPQGVMISADLVDGEVGKAIDFDGSNDNITFPDISETGSFSISWIINPDILLNYNQMISAVDTWDSFASGTNTSGQLYIGSDVGTRFVTSSVYAVATEVTIAYTYDGTQGRLYKDGSLIDGPKNQTTPSAWGGLQVGDTGNLVNGTVGELRVADTERSAAWIKATHYALTDDLLTYEARESLSDAAGWLGTWAKRKKITIDNTNIDSDLSHFPVPIVLGTSVGQSSQDLSDIFDELGDPSLDVDVTHTLTNPGGETGDTTGWTNELGSLGVQATNPNPHTGSYYFNGGDNLETKASQEVNLLTDGVTASAIDNDGLNFTINWWQSSYNYSDEAEFIVKFKNSSRDEISSEASGLNSVTPNQTWVPASFRVKIPPNTRYIDVTMHMYRTYGAANNGHIDDIVCKTLSVISKKIAITKSDGITQLYGDIEHWDDTNEKAVVHVSSSVLDIHSSQTTDLYIYYDSTQPDNTTYISDSGDTAAQSVWDTNFQAVYHMAQSLTEGFNAFKDSTSNNNTGSPTNNMLADDLVDGEIGKAIDFDGTDDYINCGNSVLTTDNQDFTVLCRVYRHSTGYEAFISKDPNSGTDRNWWAGQDTNAEFRTRIYETDGGTIDVSTASDVFPLNTWMLLGLIVDVTNTKLYHIINDSIVDITGAWDGTIANEAINLHIGRMYNDTYCFDGSISEARISNTARSAAWIKATHYALTDDLLTYDAEELLSGYTPPEDPDTIKNLTINLTNISTTTTVSAVKDGLLIVNITNTSSAPPIDVTGLGTTLFAMSLSNTSTTTSIDEINLVDTNLSVSLSNTSVTGSIDRSMHRNFGIKI